MTGDKKRIVVFLIITIVCILAVVEAVYVYIYSPNGNPSDVGGSSTSSEENPKDKLKEQFDNIFKNDLTANIDTATISKKDDENNLVYTSYNKIDKANGQYEMNVQIPHININSKVVDTINNKIDRMFKDKSDSILEDESEKEESTIYNVKYKAYINNNILSLIVKCTLKENNQSEKVVIYTYCYNIITDKLVTFDELAKMKKLKKSDVEDKISAEIESKILMEKTLEEAGYTNTVFKRNAEGSIYKYDNLDTFILDNENNLYVIFPYGNTNSTSEVDLVIF